MSAKIISIINVLIMLLLIVRFAMEEQVYVLNVIKHRFINS